MTDLTFGIETKSNDTIRAEFATDFNDSITRGESVTFDFWLVDSDQTLTVSSDTTATDLAIYSSITIEAGATYTIPSGVTVYTGSITINGVLDDQDGDLIINQGTTDGFNTLYQYSEWAGKFARFESLNGIEKYRNQIPTGEPVESLVIGINPSADLDNKDLTGIWGLVNSLTDLRENPLTTNRLRIELTVLAEYSDYADHTALEADLEL